MDNAYYAEYEQQYANAERDDRIERIGLNK